MQNLESKSMAHTPTLSTTTRRQHRPPQNRQNEQSSKTRKHTKEKEPLIIGKRDNHTTQPMDLSKAMGCRSPKTHEKCGWPSRGPPANSVVRQSQASPNT
ncbi:hypothetical protein V6N13_042795 [Hibiscus sabdariffa]